MMNRKTKHFGRCQDLWLYVPASFSNSCDKLGFSINRKTIESKKLKASGELLRLAELVD
jgi:hypothetical protein